MQTESFVNTLSMTNSTDLILTADQRMVIQNISESLNAALKPSDEDDSPTPIPPKDLVTTASFVKTLAK